MTVLSDSIAALAAGFQASLASLIGAQTAPLIERLDDLAGRVDALPAGDALAELIDARIAAANDALLAALQTPPAEG